MKRIFLLASVFAAFTQPVQAQSLAPVDVEFLKFVNNYLEEKNSYFLHGQSDLKKIEDGYLVCQGFRQGLTSTDMNRSAGQYIVKISPEYQDDFQHYFVVIKVGAVFNYCPEFKGR